MIYEKHGRYIIPFDDVPSARAKMPELSIDERKGNFNEVELGFPEDVAIKEAKRCLSCRRCLGCALCWAECKPEAIDFSMSDEELVLQVDEVIVTEGQENSFYPIREELGYGKYKDVITDIQLERMLSPTGPTDGFVMRPSDGQIPKNIVFIQSYTEDDTHLLSSVIYAINETIVALDKIKDLQIKIISPLCNEFKERYLSQAKEILGLEIIEGSPENVAEDKESLIVTYTANGEKKETTADLVVVLTKEEPSEYVKKIKKLLS